MVLQRTTQSLQLLLHLFQLTTHRSILELQVFGLYFLFREFSLQVSIPLCEFFIISHLLCHIVLQPLNLFLIILQLLLHLLNLLLSTLILNMHCPSQASQILKFDVFSVKLKVHLLLEIGVIISHSGSQHSLLVFYSTK